MTFPLIVKQAKALGIEDAGTEQTRKHNRLMLDIVEPSDQENGRVILNNDNDSMRKMVEHCISHAKVVVNPIIDWEDDDVWEFIHTENLPYCCLYDEGNARLGCIGCPMNTHAAEELERWPTYKHMYLTAFDRMLQERDRLGKQTDSWSHSEDVLAWWLQQKPPQSKAEEKEYQMMLEDFNNPYYEEV